MVGPRKYGIGDILRRPAGPMDQKSCQSGAVFVGFGPTDRW